MDNNIRLREKLQEVIDKIEEFIRKVSEKLDEDIEDIKRWFE